MSNINEMFEKECLKLGIPFDEFPYDFAPGNPIDFGAAIEAMLWIFKRQPVTEQTSKENSNV